jgi:hypothetical protein
MKNQNYYYDYEYAFVRRWDPKFLKGMFKSGAYEQDWKLLTDNNIRIVKIKKEAGFYLIDRNKILKKYNVRINIEWTARHSFVCPQVYILIRNPYTGNII